MVFGRACGFAAFRAVRLSLTGTGLEFFRGCASAVDGGIASKFKAFATVRPSLTARNAAKPLGRTHLSKEVLLHFVAPVRGTSHNQIRLASRLVRPRPTAVTSALSKQLPK